MIVTGYFKLLLQTTVLAFSTAHSTSCTGWRVLHVISQAAAFARDIVNICGDYIGYEAERVGLMAVFLFHLLTPFTCLTSPGGVATRRSVASIGWSIATNATEVIVESFMVSQLSSCWIFEVVGIHGGSI